jgi:hypothetical protein
VAEPPVGQTRRAAVRHGLWLPHDGLVRCTDQGDLSACSTDRPMPKRDQREDYLLQVCPDNGAVIICEELRHPRPRIPTPPPGRDHAHRRGRGEACPPTPRTNRWQRVPGPNCCPSLRSSQSSPPKPASRARPDIPDASSSSPRSRIGSRRGKTPPPPTAGHPPGPVPPGRLRQLGPLMFARSSLRRLQPRQWSAGDPDMRQRQDQQGPGSRWCILPGLPAERRALPMGCRWPLPMVRASHLLGDMA